MTLDGKTAVATGDSQWISSPGSRRLVHLKRGQVDAIVAGIGTVIADNPLLTARPPGARTAVRVILDSSAQIPLTSRLVESSHEFPVLVAVTGRAPADRVADLQAQGCEILVFPDDLRIPILPLLVELGRRSMTNVLVEGGGQVLGAFYEAGQVDEVDAFIAPILEGGDHPRTPLRGPGLPRMSDAVRLGNLSYTMVEGDIRVRGTLDRPWRSSLGELGREPGAKGT